MPALFDWPRAVVVGGLGRLTVARGRVRVLSHARHFFAAQRELGSITHLPPVDLRAVCLVRAMADVGEREKLRVFCLVVLCRGLMVGNLNPPAQQPATPAIRQIC